MITQLQEPETTSRYDPQMQARVVELAVKLQQKEHDHVTGDQIMQAAGEMGIEPYYVQQAMAMVEAERANALNKTQANVQRRKTTTTHDLFSHSDLRRFTTVMTAPIAIGALAYMLKNWTGGAIFLSMILPLPLACLSGFYTGRKRIGFVAAAMLIFALAPTIYHLGIHQAYQENASRLYEDWFLSSARGEGVSYAGIYTMLGVPLAGMLGVFGGWARRRYLPEPPKVAPSPEKRPRLSEAEPA